MEIVLKDRDGNPVTHDVTKDTVRMVGADGETVEFIAADDVPVQVGKTVELDFSGGDMEITPEEGQVFAGVNIPQPASLIPGNIAEGVDIAGIVGTLAAGGGVKIAAGSVILSSAANTRVTTNHGFTPDLIIALSTANSISTASRNVMCIGCSSALNAAINKVIGSRHWYRSGTTIKQEVWTNGIENTGVNAPIHSADEEGFTIYYNVYAGSWNYLIIGGLT